MDHKVKNKFMIKKMDVSIEKKQTGSTKRVFFLFTNSNQE